MDKPTPSQPASGESEPPIRLVSPEQNALDIQEEQNTELRRLRRLATEQAESLELISEHLELISKHTGCFYTYLVLSIILAVLLGIVYFFIFKLIV